MKPSFSYSLYIVVLLSLLLSACNLPRDNVSSTEMSVTQAYETIEARLTQTAASTTPGIATATITLSASPSPTLLTTPLPSSTQATTVAVSTATPRVACDQAAAGNPIDVTIPDDMLVQPGLSFTKVWRLQNTGSCTWNRSYAVAFFSGDQMGAPASVALSGDVAPGQSVDISVDMVAPSKAGKYQGNWKLRNAANVLFGIGPGSAAPFWVRIVVAVTATPTATPRTTTPTATTAATSTATATSPAHVVGTASLNVNATLDFDTDQINSSGADVAYNANDAGKHELAPQGSALMSLYGNSQPGQANCQASALGTSAIIVEDTPAGSYLCYRTGEGRYGRARLSSFNSDNLTVTLEFLTWP